MQSHCHSRNMSASFTPSNTNTHLVEAMGTDELQYSGGLFVVCTLLTTSVTTVPVVDAGFQQVRETRAQIKITLGSGVPTRYNVV
jgi:hypothetical protein